LVSVWLEVTSWNLRCSIIQEDSYFARGVPGSYTQGILAHTSNNVNSWA